MVNEINQTQSVPSTPIGSFNAILAQARISSQQLIQELVNGLQNRNFNASVLTQEAANLLRLPIPASTSAPNLTSLLLQTAQPFTSAENFQLQIQSANVVIQNGQPVVKLEGQIVIPGVNAPVQKFTSEVPLTNFPIQSGASGNVPLNPQQFQQLDEVVQNFLSQQNILAFSDGLDETIRPLLPQTLNNLNLGAQNNLNIRIISFTAPNGQTINLTQNLAEVTTLQPPAQTTQPQPPIVTGRVEVFPDANETLVRTEFGTSRIAGINNLPAQSTITFTVEGEGLPTPTTTTTTNNLLNLNPTNVQTLRLALESPDSVMNNILRSILAAQSPITPALARLFPTPDDRQGFLQGLFFLSGASKGAPADWLGDEMISVSKIPDVGAGLEKLKDLFITMQNFANRGEVPQNQQWNSYVIPFFDGSKLTYMTIQVQRDGPEGKNSNPNAKKKFIVEFEQNDVGQLAIEGLYSNVEGKVNNLDIVLKTEESFSSEVQKELEMIFNDTAIAYNFTGTLTFTNFDHATTPYTDISKILGDGIVI